MRTNVFSTNRPISNRYITKGYPIEITDILISIEEKQYFGNHSRFRISTMVNSHYPYMRKKRRGISKMAKRKILPISMKNVVVSNEINSESFYEYDI